MNNLRAVGMCILFVLFSISVYAIPQSITVNGLLTDSNNDSLTGTYEINFTIYDNFTGGNVEYNTIKNVITDANGVYNVVLSGLDIDFSEDYYLGVQVESDAEMTPRLNLTSSPYAFTTSGLEPEINLTHNVSIDSDTLFIDASSDRIGIGTGSPSVKLEVNGTINASQVLVNGSAVLTSGDESNLNVNYSTTSNTTTWWNSVSNWISGWFYQSGDNLAFNESRLNATIEDLADGYEADTVWDITGYIINDSGSLNVNESMLNATIEDLDTDTTYSHLSNFTDDINAINLWTNSSGNVTFTGGNVGIGTTSPGYKLQVGNGSDTTFIRVHGNGYNAGINLKSDNADWKLIADKNDKQFRIQHENYDPYFVIKDAGNVGIGTMEPSVKLEVNGTINASQVLVNGSAVLTSYTDTNTWWELNTGYLYNNSNNLDFNETMLNATIDARDNYEADTQKGTSGKYLYNDSTNIMFNETELNETIDAKADGYEADTVWNITGYVINDSGSLNVNESMLNATIEDLDTDTTYSHLSNFTDDINAINLWANSSGNATFTGGNVGIGTTGPDAILETVGNIVARYKSGITHPTDANGYIELYVYDNEGTKVGRVLPYTGSSYIDLAIGDWNSGNPNIMLKTGGDVGIGVGNPQNKLDVEGGLAVGATYSGTSTAPSNGAIIEGNVGIGTTTPSQKLEVSNSTQGITLSPTNGIDNSPLINTTSGTNVTITSSGGSVIIKLG